MVVYGGAGLANNVLAAVVCGSVSGRVISEGRDFCPKS